MSDESMEVESKAGEMGWVPLEKFKGDPEKWVSAEEFVRRGEEILPLLRKNNSKLLEELNSVRGDLSKTQTLLQEALQGVEDFKKYHEEDSKRQYERALADLKKEKREAIKAGDHESAADLEDAIDSLKEEASKAQLPSKKEPEAEAKPAPQDYSKDPVFMGWVEENSWYGKDKEKTAFANSAAEFLRSVGSPLKGKEFLDKVAEEVERRFGEPVRSASKVGESKGSGSSGSGNRGRSYSDLPADAKAACDRYGEKLVGEGKAFKKLEDWRKQYVNDYFGE